MNVIKEIFKAHLEEKSDLVISLWESMERKQINLENDEHKKLVDAISISYFNQKKYKKSLKYVKARIAYMESEIGKNDKVQNDFFNYDLYYSMKSEIHGILNQKFCNYITLKRYIDNQGKDQQMISYMNEMEKFLLTKYIKPINNIFFPLTFVSFILIVKYLIPSVTSSIFYIPFIAFCVLAILLSLIYPRKSK